MPLNHFYPKLGHVLICDFTRGFVAPEMLKHRPVVVISPGTTHIRKLCTVVPLSTTQPATVMGWHFPLSASPLPETPAHIQVWAKCDMLYTVSFDRLDKLHRKRRQGREYFAPKVSPADLHGILQAVRAYLPL